MDKTGLRAGAGLFLWLKFCWKEGKIVVFTDALLNGTIQSSTDRQTDRQTDRLLWRNRTAPLRRGPWLRRRQIFSGIKSSYESLKFPYSNQVFHAHGTSGVYAGLCRYVDALPYGKARSPYAVAPPLAYGRRCALTGVKEGVGAK
jgi:hypothetical protein